MLSNNNNKNFFIKAIPAFFDNYIWVIHNGRDAVAVDPGDAKPVLDMLAAYPLRLTAILLTHHHADHVGGVPDLLTCVSSIKQICGPQSVNLPFVTHPCYANDVLTLHELGLHFRIHAVPGHTLDHIAYEATDFPWLFCGDTLFAGGCGRLFEGTPAQMWSSLSTLAALHDHMQIYCAHEYTLANLHFACVVQPDHPIIKERIRQEQAKRNQGKPTLPSSIALEKATNPFLRCRTLTIVEQLQKQGRLGVGVIDPVTIFSALRRWKDNF